MILSSITLVMGHESRGIGRRNRRLPMHRRILKRLRRWFA
jgi:hypothetical protein